MERADADELASLFLQNNVLTDHVNDVGPLLDGLDRSWM